MYDHIRSRYGLKNPYFVLRRSMKLDMYIYDDALDMINPLEGYSSEAEQPELLMSLDELCGRQLPMRAEKRRLKSDQSEAMENLVHILISDRLLELSRYVWLDPASKMIRADRSTLEQNGYQLEIF